MGRCNPSHPVDALRFMLSEPARSELAPDSSPIPDMLSAEPIFQFEQ